MRQDDLCDRQRARNAGLDRRRHHHDRIADRLHDTSTFGQSHAGELVKACRDLRRVVVTVNLGEGGVAGEIGEHERVLMAHDVDASCVAMFGRLWSAGIWPHSSHSGVGGGYSDCKCGR